MSSREWHEVKLGEISLIKGGKRLPKGINLLNEKNNHPYIRVKDLNGQKKLCLNNTFQYVDDETQQKISKYIVNTGDIIISIVGTIGLIAKVDESLDNANLTENCAKITNLKEINCDYLYYYLISKKGQNEIKKGIVGAVQSKLPLKNIQDINITNPPLPEQKAITATLSCLDDMIELNNRTNQVLEEMAQAIFKHWFVDFEFPNEDGQPYKSSGGAMADSELGEMPAGWRVEKLGKIVSVTSGKRPNIKTDSKTDEFWVPLVGASSIMGYVNDYLYDEPILVIGRVGTHGIIQRFSRPSWPSDNTLVFKSKYYEFTYQILKNIDYKVFNRGSTQPLITQTDMKNFAIILPPTDVIAIFENIIGSLFVLLNNNKIESDKLGYLRDALLPKLMSGEIRVPVEEVV
jgi:type I restriction enzyme S subunit